MKKLALLLSLGVASVAFGQVPADYNPAAPDWTKVALSDKSINIRQSPSTTAAKLMYNGNDIEDYDVPLMEYAVWSTRAATRGWEVMPFSGPAPIMAEKNGWYQLAGEGAGYTPGWVSAKLCTTAAIVPVSRKDAPNSEFLRWLDGEYQGFVIRGFVNSVNDDCTLCIGKLVDGFVVYGYEFYTADVITSPTGKTKLNRRGEWFQLACPHDGFDYVFDLQKLSAANIDIIMKNAKPLENCKKYDFCYRDASSGEIIRFETQVSSK